MPCNKIALDRAFELAKSGEHATVNVIKDKLKTEGYSADEVDGKALTDQLRALMKHAAPH